MPRGELQERAWTKPEATRHPRRSAPAATAQRRVWKLHAT